MAKTKGEQGAFSAYEGLDRVIHEKARLSVLTSLVAHPKGLVFGRSQADVRTDRRQSFAPSPGAGRRRGSSRSRRATTTIARKPSAAITPEGRQRYLDYLEVLEQVVRDAASAAKARARSA